MDYFIYLLGALYRKRFWIILGTVLTTLFVYMRIVNQRGAYYVETTVYTGVISGYGIENNNVGVSYALAQNAIDNLINIILSESTLKRVSINLFARVLAEGSPDKNQNSITADSYNYTYNHMRNSPQGKELAALIVKNNSKKTAENFLKFEKAERDNYIYGLFHFQHPYYSIETLKRITVYRLGSSDLLSIKYHSADAGIAYNTIEILLTEFVHEYRLLRYGETDKVIEYFKSELDRLSKQLSMEEDDLTNYNVNNKIINYYDETKEIAAINTEFELREQEILFVYNSSKAMLEELEKQMLSNEKRAIVNIRLLEKLKNASDLTSKISEIETMSDIKNESLLLLKEYKSQLELIRQELYAISQEYVGEKYSKNGLARNNIVEQWLDQTLNYEKAKAELEIIQKSRQDLNQKYEFFAPVGTTIKRKERLISFTEQSYLSNLRSYNDALMRKKNLEMTSAALKVLDPPSYPLSSASTNRKRNLIIACIAVFLLLIAFFLLIELIDRTLHDSFKAKRIIGNPILASFPKMSSFNIHNNEFKEIATRNLSNIIFSSFTPNQPNRPYILNVLSIEENPKRDDICNYILGYWKEMGLNVKLLTNKIDYNADSSQYLLAESIESLYIPSGEDIIIMNFPSMNNNSLPTPLLKEGNLNLLFTSANYGWKSQDVVLFNKLEEQIGNKPQICLCDAPKYDIEEYTGMLPPYTPFKRISYRFSQLSLREMVGQWKDYFTFKKKRVANTNDDD